MKNETISIIIPCFNAESTLERCIESAINQTYRYTEIILVDDGSNDETSRISDEYSFKYDNVISLHKTNGGVSSARNYGLSYVTGYYVTFLDADDYLLPDFCEVLFNVICKENSELVCSKIEGLNYTKDYYDNELTIDKKLLTDRFNLLYRNWFFHNVCGKLYLTDYARRCSFPVDVRIGEDLLFNFEYFRFVRTSILVDYYGYKYVMNDNSAVHNYRPDDYLLQKQIREHSITFARDELGVQGRNISIDGVFLDNTADIITVVITHVNHSSVRNELNKISSDSVFKDISRYVKASGFKRKIIIFLVNHRSYGVLSFLGDLNKRRHGL